jgi:hypothetical protein
MRFIHKPWKRKLLLAGMFLFLAKEPVMLRQGAAGTPETVARRYFESMRSGDWPTCALLMHPEALAQFKSIFTEIAVADKTGEMVKQLFGVQSAQDLQKLAAEIMFERFFRNLTEKAPQMTAAFRAMRATMIGHVNETDDLVHVVYRLNTALQGVTVSKISAVSLKRHNDQWRVLLTGDIENLAAGLSRGTPR